MKTSGKVAVVTGASRGIGRAIALGLARDGFRLAINYRRRENEARLLAEEIRSGGGRIKTVQADLELPEAAAKLSQAVLEDRGAFKHDSPGTTFLPPRPIFIRLSPPPG